MSSPLHVEDLEVTYPNGQSALRGISFTAPAGAVTAIIGESGSGKSTIAKALLGMLPSGSRRSGTARLGDRVLIPQPKRSRNVRGRVLGYVPQDPVTNLDPLQRVGAAVREALTVTGGMADPLDLLQAAGFSDPATIARRYPHELSGGQRQRVLIALGLAGDPTLIIGDEPTSALDVTVQREVLDLLCGQVGEYSASLLLITHDIAIALERADHVIVLRHGDVVEVGAPDELGSETYTRELLQATSSAPAVEPLTSDAPVLLRATDLTKHFGRRASRVHALDRVSFSLRTGETLGIVGSSGSGKTTLSRAVLRLVKPSGGTLEIDGDDVLAQRGSRLRQYRRRIQPVFQNPYASLDPTYTIERTLAEAIHLSSRPAGALRERSLGPATRSRIAQLLEDVGLEPSLTSRLPHQLSGGQQQRVAIARALAFAPEVIVLDEAVSALDVVVRRRILDLLVRLQREHGLSYLFVSHDLSVVQQLCHRVVVIDKGRVVEEGLTGDLFADPQHAHTKQLIDAVPRSRHRTQEDPA